MSYYFDQLGHLPVGSLLLSIAGLIAIGFAMWVEPRIRQRIKDRPTPATVPKPFLTNRKHAMLAALERVLPMYRIHAQVSMGALLAPGVSPDRRPRDLDSEAFVQRIVDFVIVDPISSSVVALIQMDERFAEPDDDREREAMTTRAGYQTIRIAATGARFSQLVRLRVHDVQFEANRLMVPPSAKGRGKVKAYIRTQIDPDVMDQLQSICRDRPKNAYVLERWLHKQVGAAKWERAERVPWKTPSEMRRPWAQLAALVGRADITPYCLRHTSIVRGLKMGLPIRLVAANHDTSVMMIERHYARWITDDLEELSARAIVKLFIPTAAEKSSNPVKPEHIPLDC